MFLIKRDFEFQLTLFNPSSYIYSCSKIICNSSRFLQFLTTNMVGMAIDNTGEFAWLNPSFNESDLRG